MAWSSLCPLWRFCIFCMHHCMVARFGGQTGSAVLFPDVGGAGLGTLASLGGDGMLVFLAELFDLLSGISVGIQKFLRHCGSISCAASSSSPAQSFGAVRGTDFWRCLRWFGKSGGIWWYLLCLGMLFALGGAWLPAACPRPSTRPLPGCCSLPPLPGLRSGGAEEVNGGCGEVALWKAGVRACRRWAPP